jgi:hypothetical protein
VCRITVVQIHVVAAIIVEFFGLLSACAVSGLTATYQIISLLLNLFLFDFMAIQGKASFI